jgi:hypothetical protein
MLGNASNADVLAPALTLGVFGELLLRAAGWQHHLWNSLHLSIAGLSNKQMLLLNPSCWLALRSRNISHGLKML